MDEELAGESLPSNIINHCIRRSPAH